ncbi:hypothetical protein BJ878DRAFT_422950 [Calycina marina]|uniref:Uncharacterized protein n=1 Tax=Calycina marina TaxID=1763456 RepID=A0A9P7Z190_9HELO|nr:hypothetical protein BJ878DRAFT_422950 [Calycina marina]
MCTTSPATLADRNGPGSVATSIVSGIVKPESGAAGKTRCIECDGYECCCIPIPCTVM